MSLCINGNWLEGNGEPLRSLSPIDGSEVWQSTAASSAQVEQAVTAARSAFPAWAATPITERIAILTTFRDRLEASKAELAVLITRETGKVPWDAAGEAAATIGKLNFALKAYDERCPTREHEMGGFYARLRHRPHGVMAVYGPYNFPAHLPNGHILPALLAGNTLVFKPSELTPAVGEWMVRQWHEAGLPAGVLNLVQGEMAVGVALSHAVIDGLLFTGSSDTGKILHKLFAGRPEIMLALELGGNNALIVDQIDNIKAAVHETLLSAFISSGQRCTCARRLILIQSPSSEAFLSALVEATGKLVLSRPESMDGAFMGPLVSNVEAEKLLAAQQHFLELGANALVPMQRHHDHLPYLSPGLIDVTGISGIEDREWFGPMLQVIRVDSLDAAIAQANATQYGLSAGFIGDNAAHYQQCVQRLRAGILNWNKQTTGASGMAPFGGVGCSGNHHPAGYYSADYCAYPIASMEAESLTLPQTLPIGMVL